MSERTYQLRLQPLEPFQVSVGEAARLLGYSRRTVERMIEQGDLPSIGYGRLRRIALDDIRTWQARNRTGGPDAS